MAQTAIKQSEYCHNIVIVFGNINTAKMITYLE